METTRTRVEEGGEFLLSLHKIIYICIPCNRFPPKQSNCVVPLPIAPCRSACRPHYMHKAYAKHETHAISVI